MKRGSVWFVYVRTYMHACGHPGIQADSLKAQTFLFPSTVLGHGFSGPALTWSQAQATGTFQLPFTYCINGPL